MAPAPFSGNQRQDDVHRTGDKPLPHCDRQWISAGDLPRQVVVDAPCNAGADDERRTKQRGRRYIATPCQHRAAEDDQRESASVSPTDVFTKDDQRNKRRRHPFERQKQRRGARAGLGKTDHEQRRGEHATNHDCANKPWHVRARQLRLNGCLRGEHAAGRQSDAGTKIEQPGDHQRPEVADDHFRQRRRCAKQRRGDQREAGALHVYQSRFTNPGHRPSKAMAAPIPHASPPMGQNFRDQPIVQARESDAKTSALESGWPVQLPSNAA